MTVRRSSPVFLVLILCLGSVYVLADEPVTIPEGTTFVVEIAKDISSKTINVGDDLPLYLVHPVQVKNGPRIPRGAKITAKVIEVAHSTKQQPKGRIALLAIKAEWKDGSVDMRALPISAPKQPKPGAKGLISQKVTTGVGTSFNADMEQTDGDTEPPMTEDPKPLNVNPGLAFDNPRGDTEIYARSTFIIRQMKPNAQ
jgi:hypothetical protein